MGLHHKTIVLMKELFTGKQCCKCTSQAGRVRRIKGVEKWFCHDCMRREEDTVKLRVCESHYREDYERPLRVSDV